MSDKKNNEVIIADPVEIAEVKPVSMGMLQASSPTEMMAVARSIADPLKEFILKQGLFQTFGQKKHVEVEGWTTMLAMLGVMPQEIAVESVPVTGPEGDQWGDKYVARVAIVRVSDQQVICSASAECGGIDEPDWHYRPNYEWIGGQRSQKGVKPVGGNQRRSMAITRATGKAARVGFSWIMTLAGYSPTPLEEMSQRDRDEYHDQRTGQAPPQPPEGRSPREDMASGRSYTPGGKNVERQADKSTKPYEVTSKKAYTCEQCPKPGEPETQLMFWRDADGKPHFAHLDCWLDSELKKEN